MSTRYSKLDNSLSSRIFDGCNVAFMILFCLTSLYPFLFLISMSFNAPEASQVQVSLFPEKFTFHNYATVLQNPNIISGFFMSVFRTVLGTTLTLIVSVFTGYVLSKKYYPHRNFWTLFIVITMFFNGGLIPNYLLIKSLGLMNSIWALVLPTLVHTFQMIIARNFFMALPEELEESAKIDGAHELTILFKIVIPVSMPIIATLGLWTAVWHWNAWFDSMIYMGDANKQVLQVVMRRIVMEGKGLNELVTQDIPVSPESIKAATVMLTTLPILLVYPFAQKYFVKGIMVGSLKG